jgi:hypothetical protein
MKYIEEVVNPNLNQYEIEEELRGQDYFDSDVGCLKIIEKICQQIKMIVGDHLSIKNRLHSLSKQKCYSSQEDENSSTLYPEP